MAAKPSTPRVVPQLGAPAPRPAPAAGSAGIPVWTPPGSAVIRGPAPVVRQTATVTVAPAPATAPAVHLVSAPMTAAQTVSAAATGQRQGSHEWFMTLESLVSKVLEGLSSERMHREQQIETLRLELSERADGKLNVVSKMAEDAMAGLVSRLEDMAKHMTQLTDTVDKVQTQASTDQEDWRGLESDLRSGLAEQREAGRRADVALAGDVAALRRRVEVLESRLAEVSGAGGAAGAGAAAAAAVAVPQPPATAPADVAADEWREAVDARVAALQDALAEVQATLVSDVEEVHDRMETQAAMVMKLADSVQAVEQGAAQLKHQAGSLRGDLDGRVQAVDRRCEELKEAQALQSAAAAAAQKQVALELGGQDGRLLQQDSALATAQTELSEMRRTLVEQGEAAGRLRAELADASQALRAAISEEVSALAARQGLGLAEQAEALQGARRALAGELGEERTHREASDDAVTRLLRDELAAAAGAQRAALDGEARQLREALGLLEQSVDGHVRLTADGHAELTSRHAEQAEAHSSRLDALHQTWSQAQVDLEAALGQQVKEARDRQQRDAKALAGELQAERGERLTNYAELSAEWMVKLNCFQKQTEASVGGLEEALGGQIRELREEVIPHVQSGLADECAARAADVNNLRSSVAEEIGMLQDRVHEQGQDLERRILEQQGSLSQRLEQQSQALNGRLEEQNNLFAERLERTNTNVQTHMSNLNGKIDDTARSLAADIEQQGRAIQAALDDQGRALEAALEDQGRRFADQANATSEALQVLSTAREEEVSSLEALQQNLTGLVRQSVDSLRTQQEAQLRLLAEDSDQKAEQILTQFQVEANARDVLEKKVDSCWNTTDTLRYEITGLRALIHEASK